MDLGGGNFVIPMLIAFDLLWFSTIISLFLFISCCFCLPTTNEKFFYYIETFTRDATSIFFSSLLCNTWSYCSTISIFYRAINILL